MSFELSSFIHHKQIIIILQQLSFVLWVLLLLLVINGGGSYVECILLVQTRELNRNWNWFGLKYALEATSPNLTSTTVPPLFLSSSTSFTLVYCAVCIISFWISPRLGDFLIKLLLFINPASNNKITSWLSTTTTTFITVKSVPPKANLLFISRTWR